MKTERTLSFAAGRELSLADLEGVSAAAGLTIQGTAELTYQTGHGSDSYADITND